MSTLLEAMLTSPLKGFIMPPQMIKPFMSLDSFLSSIVNLFIVITGQVHLLLLQNELTPDQAKMQCFHMLKHLWALSFPNHKGLRPCGTVDFPAQVDPTALQFANIREAFLVSRHQA